MLLGGSLLVCAPRPPSAAPAPGAALALRAEVVARAGGDSSRSLAVVKLGNVGRTPVGVSKTHGYGSQMSSWLSLRIKREDGRRVGYPPESPDLLTEMPGYVCLPPGEELTWEIDLLRWTPEFGGQLNGRHLSFDLRPGQRHWLQAEYRDDPAWARRGRSRCGGYEGTVLSDWVEFQLR